MPTASCPSSQSPTEQAANNEEPGLDPLEAVPEDEEEEDDSEEDVVAEDDDEGSDADRGEGWPAVIAGGGSGGVVAAADSETETLEGVPFCSSCGCCCWEEEVEAEALSTAFDSS